MEHTADLNSTSQPPKPPRSMEEREFSTSLRWSIGAHAVALLLLAAHSLIFPGNPKELAITPTLRVDMVGLPDILKKDLPITAPPPSADQISDKLKNATQDAKEIKDSVNKKLPAPPPVKAPPAQEQADPDEMVHKPKAQATPDKDRARKNRSALERLKAMQRISEEVETSSAPAKTQNPTSGAVIKGNAISRGTSLTGEAREAAVASYYDAIRDRLQENWALPVWLTRQKFSARVQVHIDARGSVRSFNFVKASGNEKFDEAVKKTLNDSQPFPIPPAGIAASLLSDGILIGFPL